MKKCLLLFLTILVSFGFLSGSILTTSVLAKGNIAIVFTTAGLGDKSFNDLAYKGIKRASKELDIKYDMAEPEAIAEYETYLRKFAQAEIYDLIIAIGYEQAESLKNVSSQFPEQKFVIIDMIVNKPNVASYVYAEEERGFLIGVASAMKTKKTEDPLINKENLIGVISGMNTPLINANIAGFIAGAKYIDKDIEIQYSYVGDWVDSVKGEELALSMIENGVDIIWQTGGKFGEGVIKAAHEHECYAIGADYDQSYIAPEVILTNGMKFIDNTIYLAIKQCLNNNFKPKTHVLGIAEQGLGYTRSLLPQDIIKKLENVKQEIKKNKINIPSKINDVE